MSEPLIFDSNAHYGPGMGLYPEERWRLTELLEDLDLAGIAGALVHHTQAIEYDAMLGNRRLIEEIGPYRDRLFPCWVARPNLCGDFPEADEFMAEARQADVRAVRLEPVLHDIPLLEAVWRELREALRRENMLILISGPGCGNDFDRIHDVLTLFRGCRVLLTDVSWSRWRQVSALMLAHPELHLEFSTFQGNRALEVMSARFGIDRCLFGTGLPRKAPGAARGWTDWSLVEEDAIRDFAGGNLRRLLRGAGPAAVPRTGSWHDALTAAARAGQPLPCPVWDNHCHMLHEGGSDGGKCFVMPQGGPDGMAELMDRIGIDRAAIMSWAGPLSGDPDTGNRIVARAVERFPRHFAGVLTLRPEVQSEAEMQEAIAYYHGKLRWPGLKPFPRQTMDFDDPGFEMWFRYADRNRLTMVFDPATPGPPGTPVVEHLATTYPNLILSLDHCGKSWPYARWAVDMCRRFPTVYAQLNYTLVTNGIIEYIVGEIGSKRVLFGTDAPMRDPRPQAAWLAFTRLTEAEKRDIFGGNFQRILRRAFSNSTAS